MAATINSMAEPHAATNLISDNNLQGGNRVGQTFGRGEYCFLAEEKRSQFSTGFFFSCWKDIEVFLYWLFEVYPAVVAVVVVWVVMVVMVIPREPKSWVDGGDGTVLPDGTWFP